MAKGRGRGRGGRRRRKGIFSRPSKSSSSSSSVGASRKIAKRRLGTRSSKRLASGCKKKTMPLAESSSSLHPREANGDTRSVSCKVASPNDEREELHSSREDDFLVIAKRSLGTCYNERLTSSCKKKPMPLAESSSSLHPREADADTCIDSTVASPNARLEELHSSREDDFLRFEAEFFDDLESSGESHPHSAAPSSSPAPVALPGGPNPSRPAASAALTEMVNKYHHDPSDEPEVGSSPPLVRVCEYDVKEASAGILADIISKHGDIAAKCPLTKSFRSHLLEMVCDIVRGLGDSNFKDVSLEDIKKNIDGVADLKGLGVDVDWLLGRLEGIHKAKRVIGGILAMKNSKSRLVLERDEAKEKMDEAKQKMDEAKQKMFEAKERMDREGAKMRGAQARIDGIMESAREAKSVVERYAEKGSMLDGLL